MYTHPYMYIGPKCNVQKESMYVYPSLYPYRTRMDKEGSIPMIVN